MGLNSKFLDKYPSSKPCITEALPLNYQWAPNKQFVNICDYGNIYLKQNFVLAAVLTNLLIFFKDSSGCHGNSFVE